MNFEAKYDEYKQLIEQTLEQYLEQREPATLYAPIRYIMLGGGKRIRPVLTLLCAGAVGGKISNALHGAIAVEILHNFTLVHDDIMDAADIRRGRQTVHKKWDANAAILAGDGMLAIAHKILLQTAELRRTREIVDAFSTGIIEVCEGQAYDLEFQQRERVSLDEYLLMIEKKTARMLVLAVTVGALIGDGRPEYIRSLCSYALAVGAAFQIQDDLLDISPKNEQFGKVRGGDILEGKKTYLVVRAMEVAQEAAHIALLDRFVREKGLPAECVAAMYSLFEDTGVLQEAQAEVARRIAEAEDALASLPASESVAMLRWLTAMLLRREH